MEFRDNNVQLHSSIYLMMFFFTLEDVQGVERERKGGKVQRISSINGR